MAVVKMKNHTAVMHQGVYILEVLFPREVRMVPPIEIICVAIWGIGW